MMRMLVATDGSPHAIKAAELAARFARELRGAQVILVNVGHIPAIAIGGPSPDMMVDLGALEEGLEQAGQAILAQTQEAFGGVDVPVTRLYRRGDPAGEVIKAAKEHKADLIIMGSRGLGQFGGLILGSVSERVLHAASIPDLIVR
ncbi:MAG TPA: universal stress protein [bacterium]|nr:universal stress protein [bacterium]